MNEEQSTLEKILTAGKAEFLDKGFKSASLRNIVKIAGVTTGAFYGYFSGKEALFAALVEEHAKAIMNIFMSAQEDFVKLPKEVQAQHMGVESRSSLNEIVDYIYKHFDEFKLLVCKSEGTSYENFVHNMVEIEVEQTLEFIEVLKSQGKNVPDMEKPVCHMIVSGMFTGIFELIKHDMKKENAVKYVSQLQDFYIAGWSKILGL
ncbi:MAG: TetR/AcrR family transcriptional regulator [Eubacterium sp.]|nr:TetR/AcrR family transcriptional regulator [Eubacteriales bacterium]MDY4110806.1 TetR/AcrR family transcriptional regulator [Eubacterium sp.]